MQAGNEMGSFFSFCSLDVEYWRIMLSVCRGETEPPVSGEKGRGEERREEERRWQEGSNNNIKEERREEEKMGEVVHRQVLHVEREEREHEREREGKGRVEKERL